MKKGRVKSLFIGILIILPLQYGLVGIVGEIHSEPWPALVFPGFKSVHYFQGNYILERTHFEFEATSEKEGTRYLSPRQLFHDIPTQNINGFMRTVFTDQESVDKFSAETLKWLQERAEQLTEVETRDIKLVRSREFASRKGTVLQIDSVAVQQVIFINLDEVADE